MGRIVQQKFSGFIVDVPKGMTLTVFDARTGERVQIVGVRHWMNKPIWEIYQQFLSGCGI